MSTEGPTLLRKRLGAALRDLRERANKDPSQAAAHLGCALSKITRIELGRGKSALRERDLVDLLDLYQMTDPEDRKALLELRRMASSPGWWEQSDIERSLPAGLGPYLGLEADAREVKIWELAYVPGLLQTPAYARAVLSAWSRGDRSPDEVERLTQIREKRQRRLDGPNFELWVIIDEAALLRPVGGPEVMQEQITHLLRASSLPTVTVQIMPLVKGAHGGMRGPFTLLEFDPGDPTVAYVDSMAGNVLLEKHLQVRPYVQNFDRLRASAHDPQESAALLARLAATD